MSQTNVTQFHYRHDLAYLLQNVEHVFEKNEEGRLVLRSSFYIGEVTRADGVLSEGDFESELSAESVKAVEEGHELIDGAVDTVPLNRVYLMTQALNQALESIETALIEAGATHIDGQAIELTYVGVAEE